MPSDRSRTSDDLCQNYKAVVAQQGRVILERDLNAAQEIITGALAADARDIIGPCGTPDDGFKISAELVGSPPTLWSPPSPLATPSIYEPLDFLISPGTMYIGGQRAVFPARAAGQTGAFSYSYFDQPDWINPPVPESPTTEVISLRIFEQEVSAVEDSDLLDVALGGPDTTQRVRLMRRVERAPGERCKDAAACWCKKGFKLDPKTMRLLPQVALLASYANPESTTNPCDPVATGGYLGAFNQLIRAEIRNPKGDSPELLWGYDNASFLYRVSAAGTTLTLAQAPVDTFHQPQQNQVVEVLRMAAVLANDPNEPTPIQSTTVRCVAEAKGFVTTLTSGYSPLPGGGGTVVVQSLPPEYANNSQLFLRVWQAKSAVDPTATQPITIALTDYNQLPIGLQVALTFPTGGALPDGAFWMIAVRPATPQLVYPERFLESPQPPDGPNQWLCPLAVIDWTGASGDSPPDETYSPPKLVHDCRFKFCNLVGLTERERASCCTYRVGDGVNTFGDFTSIQTAIENLPPEGGEICVLPGRYFETLQMTHRRDVTIHGCGSETRIASPSLNPNATGAAAADPDNAVIAIKCSRHIELRSLVVEAGLGDTGILIGEPGVGSYLQSYDQLYHVQTDEREQSGGTGTTSDVKLLDLIVIASDQSGISASANSLRLEGCTIAMQNVASLFHAVYAEGCELHISENWVGLLSGAVLPAIVKADICSDSSAALTVEQARTADETITMRVTPMAGIQIGGPSTDVYILRNEIHCGRGNGVTLGSLMAVDTNNFWLKTNENFQTLGVINNPCSDGTLQVGPTTVTGSNGTTGRLVVSGPLANVHIENNRIRDMGLCGIGPVGFFNLDEDQETVSVSDLFIVGNEINHCPNLAIQVIDDQYVNMMGYGAISLVDVSGLVVQDNQMLNAGATLSDPVCGLFLLYGEEVEISRNQIIDSRQGELADATSISGLRAAINILIVTPPASSTDAGGFESGTPALCIHHNIVTVPAGLTLSAIGFGAFSIIGNQFATGGLQPTDPRKVPASGIYIVNTGTSLDITTLLVDAFLELAILMELVIADADRGYVINPALEAELIEYYILILLASMLVKIEDAGESLGLDLSQVQGLYAFMSTTLGVCPGPVIFSQNRCSVSDTQKSEYRAATAVYIFTFDDLGFHDNQCYVNTAAGQVLCDAFLFGMTSRVTSNRFQEAFATVALSVFAVGFLANISSLNIAPSLMISSIGLQSMNSGNLPPSL